MIVLFAKSLDRPLDLFGLKGFWIVIFFVMAAISLLLAIFIGVFFASSSFGIGSFLLLAIISFIACLLIQEKYSHRQMKKLKASLSVSYPIVIRRHQTVCRAMLAHKKNK